ncbi:hypothetical protein [Zooshikella ganghwensis]|uniref:WD40 repeat domain-containing protein n=1 Tax=Zooshikella ganghwensis TaxID=202772 RepID=A0A4P9VMN9_9GAMM|nr:hypothetical protein [Zooshikella ganghwensis]RDH43889.1 hypothetical protein B9G39_10780 [Zooshikella ganghwensis]
MKLARTTNKKYILPLMLLGCLAISGCNEDNSTSSTTAQLPADQQEEQTAEITIDGLLEEKGIKIEEEVWQDPESYDQPRIQFIWDNPPTEPRKKHMNDESSEEIWSVKADFTDPKLRVPKELIEGTIFDTKPSPDGRYVALAFLKDKVVKKIYDIKTKTMIPVSEGPVVPAFEWTQDSNTLYFNEAGNMKKFHIPTKKLSIVTKYEEHGNSFLLMDNDTKFVFTRNEEIIIRDVETGKKIYQQSYPRVYHEGLIKYKDAKIFGFNIQGDFVVKNIDTPEKDLLKKGRSHNFVRDFSLKNYTIIRDGFYREWDVENSKLIKLDAKNPLLKLQGSQGYPYFYNHRENIAQ